VATLIWVVVGVLGTFAPQVLFDTTGMQLSGVAAIAEIRAIYAGVFLMPAFVLARGVRDPEWRRPAVGLLTLILAGYVTGRLVSAVLDGAPEGVGIPNLIAESVGLILSFSIWRRLGSSAV
jgi:hypothetical protein